MQKKHLKEFTGNFSRFSHFINLGLENHLFTVLRDSILHQQPQSPPMGWFHQASLSTTVLFKDVLSIHIPALFVKPLAAAVRQNEKIRGIQTNTTQHETILCADNVLLLWKCIIITAPTLPFQNYLQSLIPFQKFPTTLSIGQNLQSY